ncbi:hypothetical protein HA402_009395 [Bradysia odoriphaga]|nr:hypothetical protein HA402_009395 [Bradysia odoriphaga]
MRKQYVLIRPTKHNKTTVEAKKVERAIVSTNIKMSTNSSDIDDDFGQIPTESSEESDETTSEGVNSNLEYEFLTKSDLICEMRTNIAKVAAVLNVSEGIAKSLLNQFKWNAEQLIIKYYDALNLNMFFHSLNIDEPRPDIPDSSAQQPTTEL